MLRVLHLTDPHLFAKPDGVFRGTVTYASLEAVLSHYSEGDWRADVAVVTGDLIQDDSKAAYGHFRDLLGSLKLPVYCLPGNHDVRNLMREALSEPPFFYCDSFEDHNWLVVCLDSCKSGSAGGELRPDEIERLESLIAASGAKHVMVCLHHPLLPMGSKWLDTVGIENAAEALQRLARQERLRLTLFGHVHQEFEGQYQGFRIIATPSTCRQFEPGSEKFSVDQKPPAYRRIELNPDGSFHHELVWVN